MWGIFCKKPSIPYNTIMDMNNVMLMGWHIFNIFDLKVVVKDFVSQHLPHDLGFRVFNHKYNMLGLLLIYTKLRSMDEFGVFNLESCVKLSNKSSIFGLYIGSMFLPPQCSVLWTCSRCWKMHVMVNKIINIKMGRSTK